jgi:hypothetical protein
MAGVKLGEKTARALVALLNQGGYQQEGLTSSAKADTGPITFRNDSDENVPRYGCMKVTDAILDGSRYVVLIDKPDGTGGPFLFNGPREVEPEQRGTCQHGPVVRAAFSTGTVTAGEVWGPESDWVVTSAGDPALTVYGDVEDDILLGKVGDVQITKIGKTDASVAPDATVTVSIWRDGSDTGENITGVKYDWMTSGTISSGKEVVITYFADEGIWRITGAECE